MRNLKIITKVMQMRKWMTMYRTTAGHCHGEVINYCHEEEINYYYNRLKLNLDKTKQFMAIWRTYINDYPPLCCSLWIY